MFQLIHSILVLLSLLLIYLGGRFYRFIFPNTPLYDFFFTKGLYLLRSVWNIRIFTPICRPKKNAIYVMNHSSNFDHFFLMFVWAWSGRDICILSNKYVASYPVLGYFLKYNNDHVLVDKSDPNSKKHSIEKLNKALEDGKDVYIFPEGTRNKCGRKLLPFYPGAFRFGEEYEVYPVVFVGLDRIAPLNGLLGKSTDRPIEIHILDPSYSDPKYMDEVQNRMQEVLDRRYNIPEQQRRWSDLSIVSLLGLLSLSVFYKDIVLLCKIWISMYYYRSYGNRYKFLHTIMNTLYLIWYILNGTNFWYYVVIYGYVVATVTKRWTLRNMLECILLIFTYQHLK